MLFGRSQIENHLPPIDANSIAAHYTRIGTLCHFIPAGAIGWAAAWATPVQFLNDRQELFLGLKVLDEVARKPPIAGQLVRAKIDDLRTTSGRLETDAFQMSFSGDPDELGQWRGYAANGMGCSIVTDPNELRRVADVAGWVIYDESKQRAFARKILEALRKEKSRDLIEQVLVASASYMKHVGFRPEMEFRLLKFPDPKDVKFRESGDRLVPYTDYLEKVSPLPVKRIIIGPGWQLSGLSFDQLARNHVVLGIERLLSSRGMTTTVIESSEIPYDPK